VLVLPCPPPLQGVQQHGLGLQHRGFGSQRSSESKLCSWWEETPGSEDLLLPPEGITIKMVLFTYYRDIETSVLT